MYIEQFLTETVEMECASGNPLQHKTQSTYLLVICCYHMHIRQYKLSKD